MKEKLFNSKIYPALMKLTENIINTFKFMYFDLSFVQLQHDVVSFLVMNLHKYDQEKGSKAFSYFSVVAKNYLILHNNNNYKKLKAKDAIASVQDNIKFSTNNNSKSENEIDSDKYQLVCDMIENINNKKDKKDEV